MHAHRHSHSRPAAEAHSPETLALARAEHAANAGWEPNPYARHYGEKDEEEKEKRKEIKKEALKSFLKAKEEFKTTKYETINVV
jgi:hypothetical protein